MSKLTLAELRTANDGQDPSEARKSAIDALVKGLVEQDVLADYLDYLESQAASANVRLKVSEKGCITFRGLPGGNVQYGTHLRREGVQWIYANQQKVEKFLKDNEEEITRRSKASREEKQKAA